MAKRKKKINNYSGRNFNKKRTKDKISKNRRSKLMSGIRSKKTKFEEDFIKVLRKKTKRKFNINVRDIRGCPDIVFEKSRICIFLDSDFWHGWQYPRWKHLLKNNFWRNKIENNRLRDLRTTKYLRREGRIVIRIWEHEIKKDTEQSIEKISLNIKNVSN